MSEEDPSNNLLDQASSFAKKRLDDESFVDFDFICTNTTSCADILCGKHDLVEMREYKGTGIGDGDGGQRGMHAKCNIEAGTNLVIAKPIVVCWDVEDDSDDEDGDDLSDLEALMEGQLGSDDSGGDDDSVVSGEYCVDSEGKKIVDPDAESELDKVVDKIDPEGDQKAASIKTPECDQAHDNDSDDDDSDSAPGPTGTKRNGILILRSLEKIEANPSLWTDTLSKLFPRTVDAALSLPPWFCSDPSIGMVIDTRFEKLASLSLFPSHENEDICKEISMRLPLIVRYNVLSTETCSELFVYPNVDKGGMASLAGTGLYGPEVSYFNHSCVPNVSRYCIGDVLFFVTNRNISKGEELCYSYIEHEFLCESAAKRSVILDMDFELEDNADGGDNGNVDDKRPFKKQKLTNMQSSKQEDDKVYYPQIGAEVQNELMSAPAPERLELIDELLDQKQKRVSSKISNATSSNFIF